MSAEDELRDVEAELSTYTARAATPPADLLKGLLKLARDSRVSCSDVVTKYGLLLLKHHSAALSQDELWLIHEQVAMAALDCNATSAAAALVKNVVAKFPDSTRAAKLKAMYYEATGQLDAAEAAYADVLKEEPHNETMLKRLVALARTRGNLTAAISSLSKYLDTYMNDKDAWELLAELYLESCMYKQAAFCYEELLLLLPGHVNYHVRYADVLFTLGGPSSVKAARAYYAKAVQLSNGLSLRALYGLCACAAELGDKDAKGSSPAAAELGIAAADALQRVYQEQAPDKLPLVRKLLNKQGVL